MASSYATAGTRSNCGPTSGRDCSPGGRWDDDVTEVKRAQQIPWSLSYSQTPAGDSRWSFIRDLSPGRRNNTQEDDVTEDEATDLGLSYSFGLVGSKHNC
jgi:hypothetical protein